MTLPRGWDIASVQDLAGPNGLVIDGDWVESKDQDPLGDVRLTQLADVGVGEFRDRSARYMSTAAAQRLRCTYLQSDDVLIARMPDPIGRACLYPGSDKPAVTAVDVMIWRTDGQVADAEWFVKWINSPAIRTEMAEGAGGTTRQRIAGGRIKDMCLPFPPLAEQRRIVAELEALTARLDRARAQLGRATHLIKELRRKILFETFVTYTDFELLKCSAGIFASAASFQLGKMLDKARNSGVSRDYLRNANVRWGGFDLSQLHSVLVSEKEVEAYNLKKGDVLVCEGGEPGRAAVWQSSGSHLIFQKALHRVRPNTQVRSEWIMYYLMYMSQTRRIEKYLTGTTIRHLPQVNLMAMPFPKVSLNVQDAKLGRLLQVFARADRLEAEAARARALLDRLEASLLARAFRGELVPQDPNDEPASVLLDRIRAERAAAPKPKRGRRAKPAEA